MLFWKLQCWGILLAMLPGVLGAQAIMSFGDEELFASQVDSLVHAAIEMQAFPGAQIVVGTYDSVLFNRSYGYHTYDKESPVEGTHLYDLASVTKVAAGVPALMLLVDRGLLDLDDPIGDYLPDWNGGNKRGITFREALAHQARLKPYLVFWQMASRKKGGLKRSVFRNTPSPKFSIKITNDLYMNPQFHDKMFRSVKKSDLLPEEGYVYSGLTFLFYPELVRRLTGSTIDAFLREKIYDPISAERVLYRPSDRYPLNEIAPTERDTFFRHRLVQGTVHDENAAMLDGISTNAGLFASATDLAKVCELYLNMGCYRGDTIVSKPVFRAFTQCQYCEKGNRRGLGFDKPMIDYSPGGAYVAESASPSSFGHSGFTGTFIWIDPEAGFYLVFLSNRVYPSRDQRALYSSGFRPALHQMVYDHLR